MGKRLNKVSEKLYKFRYDIFSGLFMTSFILWVFEIFFMQGHVVFSDIAFGYYSQDYLGEIFGVWNERWSTSTLLNMPRLLYILPLWLISLLFNGSLSGEVLIKLFILTLIFMSAGTMYLLCKRIISLYFGKEFNFYKIFALVTGALYYALNPWVIFRIQHIYLLCGYSLFPLLLRLFFDIFDPKFQKQVIEDYDISREKPYKKNIKEIIIFSFIYSVSAGAIHYFFYGALYFFVIGGLILVKNISLLSPNYHKIKGFIKNIMIKITVLIVFFIMFSFYWFGNYVLSILTKSQASQHNINTVDTITLFSRNSFPINIFYLDSYWWPMFDTTKLSMSYYVGGGVLIFFIIYAMVFKSYKHHIILFFTLLSLLFIILSTGTRLEKFAPYFVIFVTKTPVIGSMFRDPNKLVGLLAVGFSILLCFGVERILMKFEDSYRGYFFKGLLVTSVIVSLYFYILPLKNEFIEGFYAPTQLPKEVEEVQDNFYDKDGEFSRVLYLPVADNMIQATTGIATPYWNQNPNLDGSVKATGDIHVYSSQKNTIFHHEGNIMGITYYLAYIQNLLDKGISRNVGEMLKAFPINEIAYHDEYLGQEKRQDFNLKMLGEQDILEKHYENKIYSLYKFKNKNINQNIKQKEEKQKENKEENKKEYMKAYKNKIYTPYGMSKLETYLHSGKLNLNNIPVIFLNQNLDEDLFYEGNQYDYIETENFKDILLSSLPEKHYSFPFESIESANVFLSWGKVLVKNNDWTWFLNSQEIENFPYDFDIGKGLAVTFSTSSLDIEPYTVNGINRKIVADFDSLLRTNKFFKPDNPQFFSVQANPKKANNKIPILRGEILKGEPKYIWQVAKSGLIDAKEDNPYQFNILVSGRGTNKLHIKVRFFDDSNNEIGVSYVMAPKEEFFFDEVNFYGEYITPPNTKYMRLDLLSFQNTNQKNYWWIHDLNIYDLEEYKKENMFTIKPKGEVGEKGTLYLRTLVSPKGGILEIKNQDEKININTTKGTNRFEWLEIPNFEIKGENLEIYNRKGFNALNAMVFLSDKDKKDYEFSVNKILEKGKIFLALEGENSFEYEGNIQTKRRFPKLSNGQIVRNQYGTLKKEIEILKDKNYKLDLNIDGNPKYNGTLKVSLNKIIKDKKINIKNLESKILENKDLSNKNLDNKKKVYEEIINIKDLKKTSTDRESIETVIVPRPLEEDFTREHLKLKDTLDYYQNIKLEEIYLEKGNYELEISFDSKIPSMSSFEDIHKFDPNEVKEPDFFEDIFQENCSECESIDHSMMRHKIRKEKINIKKNKDNKKEELKEIFYMEFDATCSCDWYVYASKMMDVEVMKEYLISYDARSETIRKRHGKVMFLDKDKDIIDIQYVYEVEERFKNRWNRYEQLFTAPENAEYMQLQIWSRGDKKLEGYMEMKNYQILPYEELIGVDSMYLEEIKGKPLFTPKKTNVKLSYEKVDTMKRNFTIENPDNERVLISYGESPNPLWKDSLSNKRVDRIVNGVGAVFINDGREKYSEGSLEVVLRKPYYVGLILLIFGIILGIGIIIYIDKKK